MGTSYLKEFDDITTATNASVIPGLFDQRLRDMPVASELMENSMTSTFAQNRVEVKVKAGRNTSVKYFSNAAGEVDLYDQSHLTTAWFEPAILGGAVVYNDIEKEETGGRDGIINLQKIKLDILMDTFEEVLSENLWGDGSNGTTLGLGAIAPVSPGSGTLGHVSEASYPFWRPYYMPNFGSWATYGYLQPSDKVITFLNTVSNGSRQPDLLIFDQNNFERFHRGLGGKVSFTSNDTFGEIGKQKLRIWGKTIVWDKGADPDTMIALHRKMLKWVKSSGMYMRTSPTRYLDRNPMVSYNFVVCRHQLVPVQRNVLGRADGVQD